MKKIICMALALLTVCGMTLAMTSCGKDEVKIVVGTGGTTGTYYAYTNAVGQILNDNTDYKFTVVSTGGSVANLKGIKNGDYKMAIVQNDTMINAYNGLTDNFSDGAITNFSVIGEVYSEVVQIVVDGSLRGQVNTLADLAGLRVSIGDVGSGVEANALELLSAYGVEKSDITVNNLSVGKSADAMKDNQIDAFFFTSGAPATAITELAQSKDIYLLSLDDTVMDTFIANHKIDGQYDVYAKMNITSAQYSCISATAPVSTIGVTATFIVANDVDDDVVYNITKTIWENTTAIGQAHAVGKSMDVNSATVTVGNVPVNAGAQRYYSELAK